MINTATLCLSTMMDEAVPSPVPYDSRCTRRSLNSTGCLESLVCDDTNRGKLGNYIHKSMLTTERGDVVVLDDKTVVTEQPLKSFRPMSRWGYRPVVYWLVMILLASLATCMVDAQPTGTPTLTPSLMPRTASPTASHVPTTTPSTSLFPTTTFMPTQTMAPTTNAPTLFPTAQASDSPTDFPTRSPRPTSSPTMTRRPSESPTESPAPSPVPSSFPTLTPQPTNQPSVSPTDFPTTTPSLSPSAEPTFVNVIQDRQSFSQRFTVTNGLEFNETEKGLFCGYMASLTSSFSPREQMDDRVVTTCIIFRQELFSLEPTVRRLGTQSRRMQELALNDIGYRMTYSSKHENVTGYSLLFLATVNSDLEAVTVALQGLGLAVIASERALPSLSTEPPTSSPTDSPVPSFIPTTTASERPSVIPTLQPSPSPSLQVPPTTPSPTISENPTGSPGSGGVSTAAIAVSSIVGISAALVALFLFYRYRKRLQEKAFQQAAASRRNQEPRPPEGTNGTTAMVPTENARHRSTNASHLAVTGMASPSDSLGSNGSMLSTGDSLGMEGLSEDEADGTKEILDEFDRFKDQNLELMRNEVEDNVTGVDGMMSQALTKVLMEEVSKPVDMYDISWGGRGESMEIEASALCDVNDWLKRKEMASDDERRLFMQELLNKMVASVRHEMMKPDDASRAIHECAALLGLPLAHDLPENSVIVTGMRKAARSKELKEAFTEFGDIDGAAIASNLRGFGLVRFKSPRSVQRVMSKYHRDEVVVQDVAVMVKVLKSEGSGRSEGPWEQAVFQGQRPASREASPSPLVRSSSRGDT